MPTQSDSAPVTLSTVRDAVLAEGVSGRALRDRLSAEYDRRLATLPVPRRGVALVAVGGLGRCEVAPYSDLDLVLVSEDSAAPGDTALPDAAAERIWYPLWDSGLALDHATRTMGECLRLAREDLPALLGMLWARPVAGDVEVAAALRERVRRLWRVEARGRLGELSDLCRRRWSLAGDGSSALEPDLKQSRGGLRDGQVLQALAVAQWADFRADVQRAHSLILDVRGELHRQARRHGDVLRRQFQQAVANGLGRGSADDVLREVNLASRAIAHELTGVMRHIAATSRGPTWTQSSVGGSAVRRPLAQDLVAVDGEVTLARSARVGADPVLMLRAARVAAECDMPIAPYLVRRFAERVGPLATPWRTEVRAEFVRLLGGPAVLDVLETLDLAGLMTKIVPAWEAVRGRAQHSPVHRHTVDRHLIDTVAAAAAYLRDVTRPDLLLVAALLHDIGKVGGGDHAEIGARIAENSVLSMGFDTDDAGVVALLVRRHLFLVDTATGRDLDDPRTVTDVLAAVRGRLDILDLLYALTRADAEATGSATWTPWRATLVADLVRRVRDRAKGLPVEPPPAVPSEWWAAAETADLAVLFGTDGISHDITVIAPDRPGVLCRTAAVLGLHGLQVRAAAIRTHAGKMVNTYRVEPLFGDLPDPALLRGDLARTLPGGGGLVERLDKKEHDYRQRTAMPRPPIAVWLEHAATDAALVEVRADSSIGSLYRITSALEQCGLDIRAARIRTWASSVVASFYVRSSGSARIPAEIRSAVDDAFARIG